MAGLNPSCCWLLLLVPVVQVPFYTIASQGRKEGKQAKEGVCSASPDGSSCWASGGEHSGGVGVSRQGPAVPRLTWGCTARQQQTEALWRLQQVQKVLHEHWYICSLSPLPLPHCYSSNESFLHPLNSWTSALLSHRHLSSLMNQHLDSSWNLSLPTPLCTELPFTHCTCHTTFIHPSSLPCPIHFLLEFVSLLWPAVPALVKHSRGNLGKERTKIDPLKCTWA